MRPILALSAALFASASAIPASAQHSHDGHGASMQNSAVQLPAICKSGTEGSGEPGHAGSPPGGLDAGHKALMDSMSAMDAMGEALMAPDIDIAFVCGMIPHHQAAIAMAKAEIEYGDDPWAKKLAEKVVAAQEQEISEMLEWLSAQAK